MSGEAKTLPTVSVGGHIYTIDFALNEIRRFDYDTVYQFISMDSIAGQHILKQYHKSVN